MVSENSPIQPIADAQASLLDFVLFPGFTRLYNTVQEHLAVDLNLFILLCIFGCLMVVCRRICNYLLELLEIYYTSTVHVIWLEDGYNMLMMWISSQKFAQDARSSLVTTDLFSSFARFGSSSDYHSDGENTKGLTLHYTPWNGYSLFWYDGHLLMFRRNCRTEDVSGREEVSVSCFGRSPQILKKLFIECSIEYSKFVQDKTSVYEHQDGIWTRSTVMDVRPISTVVLHESEKSELLSDIGNFLDPTARKWYSSRGVPYRRGYLLYGPPGTGKSSLSLSIAGYFDLAVYMLNLSTISEDSLSRLFANLPRRCIVLLEDIDAVSSNRSTAEDSRQVMIGAPSQRNRSECAVSLSALLNVIDGVASQEGRVLIMTTNYIERLDEALIRPGRADKKVELGLADKKITADLFCVIFEPMESDARLPKNSQADVLDILEDKSHESVRSQEEEVKRVKQLAERFAAMVPELKFSPAEILSFLLANKYSPEQAVDNVEKWMTATNVERKEASNEGSVEEP